MKTELDCWPCFVRQALTTARLTSDDPALHERVARAALETLARIDLTGHPPLTGRRIQRLVREMTGDADPFRPLKQRFNAHAATLLPGLERLCDGADDPLGAAVRVAIAGNVIDFGAPGEVTDARLQRTIETCLEAPLDAAVIAALRGRIASARTVLYLADNAGEIVLDRLLLGQLRAAAPRAELTVAVRGAPVLNDATREDAAEAGLEQLGCRVIDSGSDVPGTYLPECSAELVQAYGAADAVIAKGQGNFECLGAAPGREVFFLFQVKCEVVARELGCPRQTPVAVRRTAASR